MEKILTPGGAEASVFLDDFYSHVALQYFVVSAIDHAHSAFANLRLDTTMAENLTDQRVLPLRLLFSHFMLGFAREVRQRWEPCAFTRRVLPRLSQARFFPFCPFDRVSYN